MGGRRGVRRINLKKKEKEKHTQTQKRERAPADNSSQPGQNQVSWVVVGGKKNYRVRTTIVVHTAFQLY